jgi:hypothetical protein
MAPVEYCSGNTRDYVDSRLPGDPSGGQVPLDHGPCRREIPESRRKPEPGNTVRHLRYYIIIPEKSGSFAWNRSTNQNIMSDLTVEKIIEIHY